MVRLVKYQYEAKPLEVGCKATELQSAGNLAEGCAKVYIHRIWHYEAVRGCTCRHVSARRTAPRRESTAVSIAGSTNIAHGMPSPCSFTGSDNLTASFQSLISNI